MYQKRLETFNYLEKQYKVILMDRTSGLVTYSLLLIKKGTVTFGFYI